MFNWHLTEMIVGLSAAAIFGLVLVLRLKNKEPIGFSAIGIAMWGLVALQGATQL